MKVQQPIKWHGGKSNLASWIHSLAPEGYTHRNIVFGGGLAEFWNWLPIEGVSEAVNDTNGELVNFWRVLAHPIAYRKFQEELTLTPFSEALFDRERKKPLNLRNAMGIAGAVSFFVRYRQSRQGLGKDYATPTSRVRRGMSENVSAWLSAVDGLRECHLRLSRVELACRDFERFIQQRDHEGALFYCDPPYLHETRTSTGEYGEHEMSPTDHVRLLDTLAKIKGRFMLSGYHSAMYDDFAIAHGWRIEQHFIANSASSKKRKDLRTECVWMNY